MILIHASLSTAGQRLPSKNRLPFSLQYQAEKILTAALLCMLHLFVAVCWGALLAPQNEVLGKRKIGAGVEAPEQLLLAVQLTAHRLCRADIGRLMRDMTLNRNAQVSAWACGPQFWEAIRRWPE